MKKTLLTGSLATLLLLAACGTNEEDTSAEESNEQADTVEETEATEDVETTEEVIEQAESKGASEVADDVSEEAKVETVETEENDNMIKGIEIQDTLALDTVNLTVTAAIISKMAPNDMEAPLIMKEDVQGGQELEVFSILYNVENTVDEPRNFFIDQAEIVTSTGEQIRPEMLISDGPTTQMAGAVKSEGMVMYILNEGTGADVEWVDVIIPTVSDDSFNMYTEEQKYRIEF